MCLRTRAALPGRGGYMSRGVPTCSPVITPPLMLLFAAAEEWRKMGGEPWQLIEPVDGFHPSQVKTQPWEEGGMPVPTAAQGTWLEHRGDAGVGDFSFKRDDGPHFSQLHSALTPARSSASLLSLVDQHTPAKQVLSRKTRPLPRHLATGLLKHMQEFWRIRAAMQHWENVKGPPPALSLPCSLGGHGFPRRSLGQSFLFEAILLNCFMLCG